MAPRTRVDETLDVLAAHGIAGITGILFIGAVRQRVVERDRRRLRLRQHGPAGSPGAGRGRAPLYAFVATYALLRLIGAVFPLRASEHDEALGMDVTQHGEEAYITGEGAILVPRDKLVPVDEKALAAGET